MDIITEHRSAISAELADFLAERIPAYAGDFDEWLRGEDPENVAYAYDLIESLAGIMAQPLSLSDKQARLERVWIEQFRDMAEEYAQAASYEAQFNVTPNRYADRRGW